MKQNWQSGVPEGSSVKLKRMPSTDGDIEIFFFLWCQTAGVRDILPF
jgi:hypothetical protein